jgi:hypothetical protein
LKVEATSGAGEEEIVSAVLAREIEGMGTGRSRAPRGFWVRPDSMVYFSNLFLFIAFQLRDDDVIFVRANQLTGNLQPEL